MSRAAVQPASATPPAALQETAMTRIACVPKLLRAAALLCLLPIAGFAQGVGSAFTYQGELRQAGEPAGAPHDFEFRLFDAIEGGVQIGPTVSLAAVAVQDGLFTVQLDFGAGQFAGDAQWLQIALRPAGGSAFQTLQPRTAVTAAPYALAALTALDGSVSSASIASGAVGTSQINSSQVQRRVSGSCPEGQYLRAVAQNGTVTCGSDATGSDWSRGGNAGTDAAVDFLGTTDAQALELRTGNARSLRIEPGVHTPPELPATVNIIAGSHANLVDDGVGGATIGGGGTAAGTPSGANRVGGNFGTVAGGRRNWVGDDPPDPSVHAYATIGGGQLNRALDYGSTVAGGQANLARASSVVAGGVGNHAVGGLSSIGGGNFNFADGTYATVAGGN